MVAEHPILGHGPGMFPHVAPNYNFPAGPGPVFYGRSFNGAHCAFLTLAAEIGLPALLCLAASGVGLVALFLRRGDATRLGAALTGAGLGILALLVQAGVEDLQERHKRSQAAYRILVQSRDSLCQAGIAVEIVSGGGTSTYRSAAET